MTVLCPRFSIDTGQAPHRGILCNPDMHIDIPLAHGLYLNLELITPKQSKTST
jgi:hypothetical protein